VIQELLEGLRSGDEEARDRLREMGTRAAEAAPALAEFLRDDEPRLRHDTLFVLEGMGPDAAPAIPALLEALRSTDPETAVPAADVLGVIGEPAVPGLLDALEDEDWQVRLIASQSLGLMGASGRDATPALLTHACNVSEREEVRLRSVWSLGEIGEDVSVLEPLGEVLEEEGDAIGCWIAEMFARFGKRARPFAPFLRDELHRDDRPLAVACAAALLQIGAFQDAAVWALIEVLQESDADLRIEAAITLGDAGSRAAPAISALLAAERDGDEDLRAQAAMAIAKIRPEYATQG
jgi:HEAT repeat protein